MYLVVIMYLVVLHVNIYLYIHMHCVCVRVCGYILALLISLLGVIQTFDDVCQ